jgi:hypothetical protein
MLGSADGAAGCVGGGGGDDEYVRLVKAVITRRLGMLLGFAPSEVQPVLLMCAFDEDAALYTLLRSLQPDDTAADGELPGRRLAARWATLRARWVTLRARWMTLRARWVTLRASWVILRARWVTFRRRRRRRDGRVGGGA